ncbi:putative integral membrane protein [Leishmania donovani]|uniref:Putative integral membrane protein n=1 Tax=Leishmania donovani TaxID=5661 RepID=A0A504X584_LEIDO|nr:putative integral membrane protein [Leishmania donovani]
MVYVRLITPALARLLDAAATAPEIEQVRRDFIEERLHALVHTQSPSQLEGALWIYIVSQQQLLSRTAHDSKAPAQQQGTNCGALEAPTSSSSSSCPLPPSLLLPESLTCISDAVRWYCGELPVPAACPAADECEAASQTTPQPPQGAQQEKQPKSKTVIHIKREPCALPAEQPGARIDELLRQRQQPAPLPAPSQPAQRREQAAGPLATVQLALDALAQLKRVPALLQPRTIALLVRDFVSLWSLVYLCKQLKRHQQCKERLLAGTVTAAIGEMDVKRGLGGDWRRRDRTRIGHSPIAHDADAEPIAVCFHDYDLLLPWDLVQRVLSPPDVSMAATAAQCRAVEEARAGALSSASARTAATSPAFALILNPAVTPMDDNPDRLRKNARIDAIDKAASKYYYALLSARAHGQTSEHIRGAPSGASSASAAVHQEALRSSLTTVDIGEYGSYALFLRDASIGFDIQVMALTGAGVGYYLGYLRGLSSEWCTLYAVVGLVTMMLVDAGLLIIRIGRQDEAVLKARARIRQQREKLNKEGEKLVRSMQAAASLSAADGAELTFASAGKAGAAAPLKMETDPHAKKNQ